VAQLEVEAEVCACCVQRHSHVIVTYFTSDRSTSTLVIRIIRVLVPLIQ
jgi:hypothetical protein